MEPIIGVLTHYDISEKDASFEFVFDSTRLTILKVGGEPLLLCPPQDIDYYKTKKRTLKS